VRVGLRSRTVTPTHDSTGAEVVLPGGMGSGGAVVRVGDTVRRPAKPTDLAVNAFLVHLERIGFDGAPRWLGTDDRGRTVLSFIDGDVGVPPYPAWSAADDLLVSVAVLQRRLHDAARSFAVPEGVPWDRANLPPPGPGALVCHNDLCVENVVVRDGRAVAFIDFDFAAPTDPMIDIAIAARHWIPFKDPVDLEPGRAGIDQLRRFALFTEAHGLDQVSRTQVIAEAQAFLDRAMVSMRRRAEEGQPLYVAAWNGGYPDQNRRSQAWLAENADRLAG
jgi:hypothetical protein